MTAPEFPFNGFADAERSARSVAKLHELFITSGSPFSVEEFSRALASALTASPDPDLAVTNLLRFAEATMSRTALFTDLVKHPVLMDVLVQVVSYSHYFADILVRDPELFRWLTASDALVRPRTREFLHEEAERAVKLFRTPERKLDALKRLYRREILRVGARDILGEGDLETLTAELSFLADVLVDAACGIAHQQLEQRYPARPATPYAVIGLGKLGGGELNYSSDIDIIFVYKDEGELPDAGGRTRTYHEYFNALVEKLVVNLSQTSGEGHLYRVDTRLRPESGAGPLARSLQSYLLYYESRGELWERQMLIKARAVAGDGAFGEEFIARLEPFVYPRSFLENPKTYVARIKSRIEGELAGEENVKLRAGGIRDIEFVVQVLQLLNGGRNTSIRSRKTLEALRQLRPAGLLTDDELRTLTEAYVFFRTVEHRLQAMLNIQTHDVPKEEQDLAILAKKVGVPTAAAFRERSDALRRSVRKIFENVLLADALTEEPTLQAIMNGNVGMPLIERVMAGYGFSDRRKAGKNFLTLLSGNAMIGVHDLDARAQSALRTVAEPLFAGIAKSPVPDATLHNFALLASAQPFPEQLYTQLREENFRHFVLTICSGSTRFVRGLSREPLLLEMLASDPDALAGTVPPTPPAMQYLVSFKNREELRSGIRFILGITTFDALAEELTAIADCVVVTVVQNAVRRRKKGAPLAVMALGKYGTREITFDADLDLLFIADPASGAGQHALEKIATTIVRDLTLINEEGKLYDVDARLRPEGKSAPLAVARKAYVAYLSSRASLWERQSLTRLRFVAGDPVLGERVLHDVEQFVYDTPLPPAWVDDIVTMRRKTESRSRASGADFIDIKLGPGGMVDVEFLAQMLQLRFGTTAPHLRRLPTRGVLQACNFLPGREKDLCSLGEAYAFYRKIETALRVSLEQRSTVIPEGELLEHLAKYLGVQSGGELARTLTTTGKEVRRTFLALSEQLKTGL